MLMKENLEEKLSSKYLEKDNISTLTVTITYTDETTETKTLLISTASSS